MEFRRVLFRSNATLDVLRGPGTRNEGRLTPGFVSVSSSAGSVDLTQPMQASYVPRAGAMPIGPFIISPKGLIKVEQEIFPEKYKGKIGRASWRERVCQ